MHQAVPVPHDELAAAAAARLAELSGVARHEIAVILGSGWAQAARDLGEPRWVIPRSDLPGFAPATAAGHPGTVASHTVGGREVLLVAGRTHLYEGHGVDAVAHPVRTAAAAGCRVVVLTNACGGLDPAFPTGSPVLIRDQINLTGTSPLTGPQFVDLSDLYSARLRAACRTLNPDLAEGVYVQFRGPQYETPAEIAMVRGLGGDLVGMSTALEAIAAKAAGMEVLGLALVTNPAAGLGAGGEPLRHEDVLAAGTAATASLGRLLAGVLPIL